MRGQVFSFADSTVMLKSENDTVVYKLKEIKSIRYHGPVTKTNKIQRVRTHGKNDNSEADIDVKPIKIEHQ
jgi:hypothetical protein